jgi:hypothetical protein
MPRQILELEQQVLEKLLAGDHPILVDLRRQLSHLQVAQRELTGSGFVTSFSIDASVVTSALLHKDFKFGDVTADIEGLEHGAGFLLYVRNGAIDALEGYSFEEPWPESVGQFRLSYMSGVSRSLDWLAKLSAEGGDSRVN